MSCSQTATSQRLQAHSRAALRAGLRATARYILRGQAATIDRSGGDPTAAVIMVAIMHGNVRHLDMNAEGPLRFAAYDDPPPDRLRRPVTAVSLAERLGLPRETVRRRLEGLVAAGRCERQPGGVIVPQAVVANSEHLEAARATYAAARRLRQDAEASDPEFEWPRARLGGLTHQTPPYRLINRRLAGFGLDVLVPIAKLAGDYELCLVYLALIEATGRCADVGDAPRVSCALLAESLNAPAESTRRRLTRLAEAGLIDRNKAGYSAEPHPDRKSDLSRLAVTNRSALQRLFRDLAEFDVDFLTAPSVQVLAEVGS